MGEEEKFKMTVGHGLLMFFIGMGCIAIAATIIYFVINNLEKDNEKK
ncbi:hypothetical protein [Hyphomonas sp.]|nr:hypothetical protein [Hyphomonas sp.]